MPQTKEQFKQEEGFETDGTKRLPICFCLDTSGSMRKNLSKNSTRTGESVFVDGKWRNVVTDGVSALSELKRGMRNFFKNIERDPIAVSAAEIAIVTFDDYATSILDFCRLRDFSVDVVIDRIDTRDNTYLGEGLNMALDKLEDSIIKYQNFGIGNYPPWLVVMSDGEPNGSDYELEMAKKRICAMVRKENLAVIPIGIGSSANMKCLSQLSPGRDATGIYDVNFDGLFEEMTKYVDCVSKMTDGSGIIPDFSKKKGKSEFAVGNELQDTKEMLFNGHKIVTFFD
ncbi:MAG: VWA domain-containing protein [Lachnospiraceae bacterium]|nr:VWA domain-containing protein [Lachnospiraceae bacterium]